jgi:hypothetical protein
MLNLDAKLFGFLAEQRFKPVRDGFYQHLAASARNPDEMILKHDNRPSVVSVACCHKHSVAHRKGRKHVVCDARRRFILSAKAGGFLASTLVMTDVKSEMHGSEGGTDVVRLPWKLQAHPVGQVGFDPAGFENSV